MITKNQLLNRLAKLRSSLENLNQQALIIQANQNATSGAIQECEYWLSIFEMEEEKPIAIQTVQESKVSDG